MIPKVDITDEVIPVPVDKLYASELRAAGFDIPKEIPDCAWVPRYAVRCDFKMNAIENHTLKGTYTINIDAPWSWIEASVKLD